jgi:hypothetical protein
LHTATQVTSQQHHTFNETVTFLLELSRIQVWELQEGAMFKPLNAKLCICMDGFRSSSRRVQGGVRRGGEESEKGSRGGEERGKGSRGGAERAAGRTR